MAQVTIPAKSSWLASLTYDSGSGPTPTNGFGLSTGLELGSAQQGVTPFGTAYLYNQLITGPGSQQLQWFPVAGSCYMNGQVGYGFYSLTVAAGIGWAVVNNSVSNALFNGAAFGIGATQTGTGSTTFTLGSTLGGTVQNWVTFTVKHSAKRYLCIIPGALVSNWVNSSDHGRFYWRFIARLTRHHNGFVRR